MEQAFNASRFLAELAAAYDALVEWEKARNQVDISGHEVGLRRAYHWLVTKRQWLAGYSEASFTWDLHRLFLSGIIHEPGGRRLHLAPARIARNNLQVLNSWGLKTQLGLIAFR